MLRRRLSYANVMSSLAVFLALGGISYAAVTLPRNSVKGKQIARNAVGSSEIRARAIRSGEVRDRSLLARDFAPGQFPAGRPGAPGAPGAAGRSALSPLRSGETVYGYVGFDVIAEHAGDDYQVAGQLPIPAPENLTDGNVDVNSFDEQGGRCTGTSTAPSAPPGVLCVYLTSTVNAAGVIGLGGGEGGGVGDHRFGFRIDWTAPSPGEAALFGTYAYTAP